jgi:peroxiredoxin
MNLEPRGGRNRMTRMRSFSSLLLVGAVLGFPLLSHAGQGEAMTKKTPSVGDQAPDFTLKDFQGKRFTLSELKGHEGALLWFTNLCEGCQSKFGEMEKFKREYSGKGIEVIALSQLGKDRKTVEKAVRANHLTLRFLYDPKGEVTTRYSGRYVPGTCPLTNLYVIDQNGLVVSATHYPGVPEAEIAGELAKMRAGTVQDGH